MTDAPYGVEAVAAPPRILAEMQDLVALHTAPPFRTRRESFGWLGMTLAVILGTLLLVDLVFGVVRPRDWVVLVLGAAILLLPALLIHRRGLQHARAAQDSIAPALRAQAEAGQVLRHTLHRDARHWFVEHEHGVIHLCPADAARTLYLDLSGITGDDRHDRWYAERLIDRARWTWFTTPDHLFVLGFEADGDPLPRRNLEAARRDPEIGAEVFEFLGSPTDGDLLAQPFEAVDAFLRTRATPAGE